MSLQTTFIETASRIGRTPQDLPLHSRDALNNYKYVDDSLLEFPCDNGRGGPWLKEDFDYHESDGKSWHTTIEGVRLRVVPEELS